MEALIAVFCFLAAGVLMLLHIFTAMTIRGVKDPSHFEYYELNSALCKWSVIAAVALVLIAVIIMLVSSGIANRKHTKKKQHCAAQIGLLTALMNEYCMAVSHSVEEPRAVWEECTTLMENLGIRKGGVGGGFCRVYEDVYYFLKSENLYDDCGAFAAVVLDFYYQVAFSYDLDFEDQKNLLRYFSLCFRDHGGCVDYQCDDKARYRQFLPQDYDWSDWDGRYLSLLEEGCRKGNTTALVWLAGNYYDNSRFVPFRDYDKAFALYQQAAKLGDAHSFYMIGQCYEQGYGVKKNYQKAGDCYRYAYEISGNGDYAKALDKLYTRNKWNQYEYSPDIVIDDDSEENFDDGTLNKENLETLRQQLINCAKMDLESEELDVVAFRVRKIQEKVVNAFVKCYAAEHIQDDPVEKINILHERGYFTNEISSRAHFVRKVGNQGVHDDDNEPVTPGAVRKAIVNLHQILEYYAQY